MHYGAAGKRRRTQAQKKKRPRSIHHIATRAHTSVCVSVSVSVSVSVREQGAESGERRAIPRKQRLRLCTVSHGCTHTVSRQRTHAHMRSGASHGRAAPTETRARGEQAPDRQQQARTRRHACVARAAACRAIRRAHAAALLLSSSHLNEASHLTSSAFTHTSPHTPALDRHGQVQLLPRLHCCRVCRSGSCVRAASCSARRVNVTAFC